MLSIPTIPRVALLIDADNVQSHLEQILKLSGYYGNLKIRRAYGDWKKPPLSASYDKLCNLNIDCKQVDRIEKNSTDKQLMNEADKILDADDADIFILVSGDGDFRLLCKRIKQKDRKVVGIGNKGQTSTHLPASCDAFYYIEDLEKALIQLERLQEFKTLLFRALGSIPCDKEGWIHCGPLGTKLRELDPGFKAHFSGKKLSAWLSELGGQVEIKGQLVRLVDPEDSERIALLREAHIKAQRIDGLAHIGQIGEVLRKLDAKFDIHFGKKKLSEWFKEYSHLFQRYEDYISLSIE